MARTITLLVTVDTESDAWSADRTPAPCTNLRRLPAFDAFLRRLGARPTYLVTWRAAADPWAAGMLGELARAGHAELGAHLHPWTCPPLREAATEANTMCCNLPPALLRDKLERLTDRLAEVAGTRPVSFRAGRWGFGPSTAAALVHAGYLVDSSVTPWVSWEEFGGPSFAGAPSHVYRIAPERGVLSHDPDGPLIEVPVTGGYTRGIAAMQHALRELLTRTPLRALRLAGIGWRTGLLRRVWLTPEDFPVADLLAVSRRSLAAGADHLTLALHSQSLVPGLVRPSRQGLQGAALEARIAEYVERLHTLGDVRFATLSEVARRALAAPPAAAGVRR